MKRVLFVFGTRPEAIKLAPLVKEFQKFPLKFKTYVCLTAQHRELLDQVLEIFEIIPDFDLNIMKSDQDLTDITARVLMGLKDILIELKPDLVLVHGDTTTSMAAALAAYYQKIPVGHIEAGLRTHDIYSPWPEEINRQITGRIAKWHFSPTSLACKNLIEENVPSDRIFITGNTVIDALKWVLKNITSDSGKINEIEAELSNFGIPTEKIESWKNKEFDRKLILITGHRRENFGEEFTQICLALKELSGLLPNCDFVYPMHLNPNVRNPISRIFGDITNTKHSNIYFIEPLRYLPFVYLMNLANIILTDSGGIQEEAPSLGKPVLVMRETTERPEALEAGTVKLVGTNRQLIVESILNLTHNDTLYEVMSRSQNPYGDGTASERIVQYIIDAAI